MTGLIILAVLAVAVAAYFLLRPTNALPEPEKPEALPKPEPPTTPKTEGAPKVAEAKVQEPKTTDAKAPETKAPETKAPETKAPETKAPETKAPETKAPETKAPETKAPESKAPESKAPESKAPETRPSKAPEASVPSVVEAAVVEARPAATAVVAEVSPKPVEVAPRESQLPKAPAKVEEKVAAPEAPKRDLSALKKGLSLMRSGWMQKLLSVFGGKKEIDPALLETIEETLLTGDVGTSTTKRFVDGLRERLDRNELADEDKVWAALKQDSRQILNVQAAPFGHRNTGKPLVILMVGVNGAGKTTTIAKLASRYKDQGKSVLLAAGDTFRAAAVTQLEMWGRRVGVPVSKGKEGAKPSSVVYDAIKTSLTDGIDVVIADTAGRLQTKAPLMEELRKIRDACEKACPGAPHETLLVLDATTGQNALSQAREFKDTLELTGIVLTKLDGTAKGGVVLAVADEFKLPVRFIGVGEKSDDLREFDADDFVDALFSSSSEDAAA